MNIRADIESSGRYWPQFDASAPPTKLEALLDGDSEIAAEQFVDWLADPEQRETLYHMLVARLDADDVHDAAQEWAKAEQAEEL